MGLLHICRYVARRAASIRVISRIILGISTGLILLQVATDERLCSIKQRVFGYRCTAEGNRLEQKTKNLVLSYASGSLDVELFNVFLRSLRATGSDADVVVMIDQLIPSEDVKLLAQTYDAKLLQVDTALTSSVPWSRNAVLFRFLVWRDFLTKHRSKYCYVLNSDLDVYFQSDPFLCFFGRHCDSKLSALHGFGENPALRIGDCPIHSKWYVHDCVALGGEVKFAEQRHRERICAGFTIGTAQAHLVYLNTMSSLISAGKGTCNDQAIHNMIFWGDSMPQIRQVYVWDYFRGPVKTLDSGFIRDEFGRITNELGAPYCVVHQFKGDRNPKFLKHLRELFPLHECSQRVHFEDIRFAPCEADECRGEMVHSSVMLMIAQNITGGWRGTMPTLQRSTHKVGPLPSQANPSSYEYVARHGHLAQ